MAQLCRPAHRRSLPGLSPMPGSSGNWTTTSAFERASAIAEVTRCPGPPSEEGGPGGGLSPPACWPPGSPEGSRCRPGRDARSSRANVRLPAAAQLLTVQPFALDDLPGTTPRRSRSVAGRGRAFGACCFAGKLRSPAGPGPASRDESGWTLRHSLRQPLRHSLRAGGAYPWLRWPSASVLVSTPSWGQSAAKTAADWPPSGEWSERSARCASRD